MKDKLENKRNVEALRQKLQARKVVQAGQTRQVRQEKKARRA